MPWPTPQDYSEAVQNPRLNFRDPELQSGELAINNIGLPIVASGSFASVYRMTCGEKRFAVRCFLKHVPEQHARYEQISKFVMNDSLPYTVDFNYLSQGILVKGQWHPILKMDWVDGVTLDTFVRNNLQQPETLNLLAEHFKDMMRELHATGIAHGDLQHGNILITDKGELRLVDYDGMFVPGMEGLNSGEIGHRNYQHPGREGVHFDANIDNFSAWSIYASLVILSREPQFAASLAACDECLLFRQGDYRYPLSSRAFGLLEQSAQPRVVELSKIMRTLLSLQVQDVPPVFQEFTPATDLPAVSPEVDAPYARPPQFRPLTRTIEPAQAAAELDAEMRTHWPSLKDYINSMSNPARSFIDPSMHNYILVRDHGLIRAQGTDHGAVFHFRDPHAEGSSGRPKGKDVMVKVFMKADQLIEHRYKGLHTYLHGGASNHDELRPHFARFTFIPEGVRVGQKYYPIVRMNFVSGPTLYEAVEAYREDKVKMRELIHEFVKTMALVESSGIVHGDIEPENLIVKSDRLILLDYDLTTTPNTRPLASVVAANKHYRHPRLPAGVPVPNDNFAAWIMYYSMKTISLYPQIWNIGGAKPGRLLFHADDLKQPNTSHLIKMLRAHYNQEVRQIAEDVVALCKQKPEDVQPLRVSVRVYALAALDALQSGQPALPALQTLTSEAVSSPITAGLVLAGVGSVCAVLTVLNAGPLALMLLILFVIGLFNTPKKNP